MLVEEGSEVERAARENLPKAVVTGSAVTEGVEASQTVEAPIGSAEPGPTASRTY